MIASRPGGARHRSAAALGHALAPALALAAALASALSACGARDVSQPDVVRADSSGVRLITSTAPDKDLAWTFTEQSVLMDSAGEPYLFTGLFPGGVVVDRGGRVYVLGTDRNILRFDREGRFERTLGRRGGGPGEMQLPQSLGAHGDTLVVRDIVKGALVRFGPDLQPLGDRLLTGALEGTQAIAFRFGGLWVEKESFTDSATTHALFADTSGSPPLHSVSVRRGGDADFGCVRLSGMPRLFSPSLTWSASGPRIIVNAGPRYEIWMHEGARATASIRRAVPSRAPTLDDVRSLYPEGMKVRFPTGECVTPVEKVAETLGLADVFPAVHGLVLLSDGSIWVQRTPGRNGANDLDVFAPDGSYAGTARGMATPVGLMPGGDLLVPRADEESGGYHLVRMKVVR